MQLLGYRCLYGLFLIPALFFGLAGNLIIAVVPAVRFGSRVAADAAISVRSTAVTMLTHT